MFRKQLFILLFAQADTFINEEIKNNKHLKLIIKQHRKRRICMPGLGKFKIERTQFKTKTHTGTKTIILFDFFFNFRKRGILLKGEEINILTQLTKTSSMQEIANSCGCSRQTISNYCKKLIYNSEERVITKEDCIVYVAADSTFTHMNRKKGRGLEVKTLVLWTNMESINNSKLSDLSLIHVTKDNSDNIYGLIKEKVSIRYPEYRAIKVVGDGAVWIKNLGESFDGFYLDKFHYMNAVQSLISSFTGRNKKILSIISDLSKKIVYENVKDENPMKSL